MTKLWLNPDKNFVAIRGGAQVLYHPEGDFSQFRNQYMVIAEKWSYDMTWWNTTLFIFIIAIFAFVLSIAHNSEYPKFWVWLAAILHIANVVKDVGFCWYIHTAELGILLVAWISSLLYSLFIIFYFAFLTQEAYFEMFPNDKVAFVGIDHMDRDLGTCEFLCLKVTRIFRAGLIIEVWDGWTEYKDNQHYIDGNRRLTIALTQNLIHVLA